MEITKEQVHEAYAQARRVYDGPLPLFEAKSLIAQKTGMNEGSAHGCINAFLKIMEGSGYTRTINTYGADYYLNNIKKDYGNEALLTTISSINKHLEYYEGVGKSSQPRIQNILKILKPNPLLKK